MTRKVRLAIIDDYDDISNLMGQVHNLHVDLRADLYKKTEEVFSLEQIKSFINNNQCYVVEYNDIVVGMMLIFEKHLGDQSHQNRYIIFIDTIVVDQRYRRLGIGKQLINYAIELKEKHHYDSIELEVNALNEDAIKMYQQMGFTNKSITMELN